MSALGLGILGSSTREGMFSVSLVYLLDRSNAPTLFLSIAKHIKIEASLHPAHQPINIYSSISTHIYIPFHITAHTAYVEWTISAHAYPSLSHHAYHVSPRRRRIRLLQPLYTSKSAGRVSPRRRRFRLLQPPYASKSAGRVSPTSFPFSQHREHPPKHPRPRQHRQQQAYLILLQARSSRLLRSQ